MLQARNILSHETASKPQSNPNAIACSFLPVIGLVINRILQKMQVNNCVVVLQIKCTHTSD